VPGEAVADEAVDTEDEDALGHRWKEAG